MQPDCEYALSLKQPWATLVLLGLKTIEVRRWPTARRGRIYIHAARVADDRAHGWDLLPDGAHDLTQRAGGLLGKVSLTQCVTYRNQDAFVLDQAKHLNDPSWYDGSTLYGFTFADPEIVTFRSLPGWMRFFRVDFVPAKIRKKTPATRDQR